MAKKSLLIHGLTKFRNLFVIMLLLLIGVSGVKADDVIDELTYSLINVSGTSYKSWTNKKSSSDAVYAGNSAGGNNSIQLRSSNNNSGIVTTTSGGKVKSVTIEWNSNTDNARTLEVYGKNTVYSSASDLYSYSTQGTLIGSAAKSEGTKTITINDSYDYIGFRSKSGAIYVSKITIVWDKSGSSVSTVSTPTFSPAAGEVDYGTTVTLTQNVAEMIMYTVDGTDPSYANNNGEVYENPIEITAATTIKAIAVDADENESSVATAAYTIKKPNAPTFTPAAGTVNAGTEVTLSADAENIYYTLDGSTPTSSSTPYTNAITVNETTTIKAIAVDGGGNASEIAEATYIVIPAGAEEVTLWSEDFSSYNANNVPSGGTFNYSCSGTGTKIYAAILAGGVSPELLVAKNGGTFTAVIPLNNIVGDLTLTYKTNANKLQVSTDTEGITGGGVFNTAASHTVTFNGITKDTKSITIIFTATESSNVRLDDIVLTGLQMPAAVKAPTFSPAGGTFFGPQSVEITCTTDGATIYYTIDGTEPTTSSTKYKGAISISETTTMKAIAVKDGESSSVASAVYTIPVTYNNIAALIEAAPTETSILKLTNAQVLYVNNKDMYVKDESGAIDLYNCGLEYTAGTILNGSLVCTYTLFNNNLPEINSVDSKNSNLTTTDGVAEPVEMSAADITLANDVCNFVKIAGDVTSSESNDKTYYYVNGFLVYNKWNINDINLSSVVGKYVTATGIVVPSSGNPALGLISINEVPVVAQIGTQKYETLQAAVNAAKALGGEQTITLLSNISEETVTIEEVAGFKLTIDGKKDESTNYTVDAVIVVDGLRGNGGSSTNGASVTLQNIAFVKTTSTDGIQASHYPHHLTIQDCTYTGSDSDKWFLNASVDGPLYGVTVKNVTVEHARLIYANMAEDAVFQNITATTDCKVGFNVKTSGTALIENCQVTTAKYAFRDYSDGYVGTFTLKDNTFISTSTGSDEGAIVNRGGAVGTTHINVVSGNYSGKILVLNNKEGILAISGGIFSERVADEYLAEGKICASNTDEETSEAYPFIVREGHYRAQVGEQKYEFFADAVEALTEENNVVTLLADVEDEYTLTVGQTLNVIKGEFALTVNAPEGYELKISEADGITTYTSEAPVIIAPAAPIVFHDSGEYESGLSVPMYAQAGAKIYYTTDGSEPTTASTEYTGALTIENATTLKAIAVLDGVVSAVVTREYTIKAPAAEIEAIDGYYSIKNNGNEKYINVAGRKTVTFVADGDEADKAGTVLKVKINTKGQVEELRSQGVDLPGYADRAMNYVPKFVKLIVDKLHAEGSGEILGEHGLDAIMQKFNDSFDYHLYVEKADAGYRIYGKTPSMKPVVDFYAENKDNVDYKLPQLEAFINSAIQKVLQKTGGRGASILTEFKLHDIWQKMGETLTEPVKDDAASIAKFYEEVLASEANVWNFAYQTAMIYWNNVKSHPRYEELKGKLGEYANYIEKVENIQPDFKYYIVGNTSGNGVDFISEGNIDIQNNAARTIWTMNERNNFAVTFTKENSLNIGRELYTTLYVDFAYTLPETVKAYKVTAIDEKTGLATKEEITGVIPAQTPVLLQMIVDPKTVTDEALTQILTLSTEAGTAVTGNLLQGPEWLINKYSITAKQVEDLFGYVHDFLKLADVEALYDSYVKEYEYLMMRNAGTVNNKYFFGLSGDDIADADVNVCQLAKQGDTRKRLAFYHNLEKVDANKAFIPSEKVEPVYLSLIGDVNRDGYVNITDVTCQIDIVLGKDKPEDNYDYDAADLDFNEDVTISDVTDLIDVVLGKKTIE